jgi:hypothetical protein
VPPCTNLSFKLRHGRGRSNYGIAYYSAEDWICELHTKPLNFLATALNCASLHHGPNSNHSFNAWNQQSAGPWSPSESPSGQLSLSPSMDPTENSKPSFKPRGAPSAAPSSLPSARSSFRPSKSATYMIKPGYIWSIQLPQFRLKATTAPKSIPGFEPLSRLIYSEGPSVSPTKCRSKPISKSISEQNF